MAWAERLRKHHRLCRTTEEVESRTHPLLGTAPAAALVGCLLALSACSSLGQDDFSAVGTSSTTTAVPSTTRSTIDEEAIGDGTLPRTGPTEAAVFAAVGSSLILAGRALLDWLGWLDRLQLARTSRSKRPLAPR